MTIRQIRRIRSAAALLVLSMCHSYGQDRMESLIPNDCVMFVRLKSPEALGKRWRDTALGRAVTSTELADAGLDLVASGARFFSTLAMGTSMSEIRAHFLNDVGLAVFDIGADQKKTPPMAFLFDVSRDPSQARSLVEETIVPRLKSINPKIASSSESYEGVTLGKIQAPRKPAFYWTFAGQVFAIGNAEGLRKIVDGSKNPSATLGSFDRYLATKGQVDVEVGALTYVNTEMLVDKVRPLLATRPKQRGGLVATGVLGMKAVAVSMEPEGDGVRNRLAVFTGGETTGLLRLAAAEPAVEFAAPKLMPEDHHLCVAAKLGSGDALMEAFQGFVADMNPEEKVAQMGQFADAIAVQAGIDWQADFTDVLGGEMFLALRFPNFAELAMERRGPKPRDFDFLIGLSVESEDAFRGTLDSLFHCDVVANNIGSTTPQDYKGRQLSVISLAKTDKVTPCYTFEKGCFVFALSPETIERFIDRAAEGQTLASGADFKKSYSKVAGQGNVLAYADVQEVLTMLLQLVELKAPKPVQAFLPELKALPEAAFGVAIAIKGEDYGLSGQSYGPVGALFATTTLASLGNLTKSGQGRRAQAVKERMKKVRNQLRKHRAQHGEYPQTLDVFVNKIEENHLLDPFLKDRQFEYARTGSSWVLVSVGPDGKLDVDPTTVDPADWKKMLRGADPAAVQQAKSLIYQFQKKRHHDEKAVDDEGDIVLVGP